MLTIVAITTPIFIMMVLGFLAVRVKLVPSDTIAGMSKIVLYFTLPALIFSTLARMEFDEVIVPTYLVTYAVGSMLTLFIGLFISVTVMKRSLTESTLKGLGMANSNSAFFAYPVMLLAFSSPPTAAFAMSLIIENMLILPLAFIILEASSSSGQGLKPALMIYTVMKRLIKNPLIIAVTGGVLASTFHLTLPAVIDRVLVMLSGASATLALIVLGGSLVGTSLKGNAKDITFVACGKLILHPMMIAIVAFLMPDMDRNLVLGGILIAAVPMMSIYPIIGNQYGYRSLCASILLVTTLASFVTLAVILSLMRLS
ncbi:AEC family transporter [Marinomonas sp. IMCC 4694]|uniref:AEC family transporter n=1 Tax=Marinomonas sp. IMCC 4694 TaxID=2605432 RepID=UPI0011E7323E|nr:AEC family transporter [Marinomonas sp. IMCC 4694]TYL48833.1 AEC family transporter [Marinomonas sp. IMCC 4694]